MRYNFGELQEILTKLTQVQVIQYFLPRGMWQKQHKYYVHIRSKEQRIAWGTNLCENMIEAAHS